MTKSALGPLYALTGSQKKKVNKWKQTNEQTQQQQQKPKQHVQLSHKKELSFFETHILQMEEPAESKRKVTGFSKAAYF